MNRILKLRNVRTIVSRFNSTTTSNSKSTLFMRESVQHELKFLTGVDYEKVFRVPRRGEDLPSPIYQFVTDEELGIMREGAARLARKKLQMPPVMDERQPINEVLDVDEALKGYDSMPIVFTDITFGVHDRDRVIVVREPNGVLREAEWEERDRMNSIYFPKDGRKMDMPAMFEEENLKEILSPDKYEYILDRNCVQFEPDHPIFVRTAKAVYEDINKNHHYDSLSSTRHFGPLVFYLVDEKMCDDLIVHYFQMCNIEKALSVIKLYTEIHPDSKTANCGKSDLELLRYFISEDSLKSSKLHAALETALERIENEKNQKVELEKAHGTKE